MAGDICNTNAYEADDEATHATVRAMFEEQIAWAVDERADFLIAETIDWCGEAEIALDVIKRTGKKTGRKLDEMDLVEINEAFAAMQEGRVCQLIRSATRIAPPNRMQRGVRRRAELSYDNLNFVFLAMSAPLALHGVCSTSVTSDFTSVGSIVSLEWSV